MADFASFHWKMSGVTILGTVPVVTRHSLFLSFGIPPHIGESTAAISDRNRRLNPSA
jgi:hypothetical protein